MKEAVKEQLGLVPMFMPYARALGNAVQAAVLRGDIPSLLEKSQQQYSAGLGIRLSNNTVLPLRGGPHGARRKMYVRLSRLF
jgi:hypothetical protein